MTRSLTTKHAVLGDAEAEAVAAAIRSADLSGTSAVVSRYEVDLAGWFGVRFAVACSSGTAAVHLALMATGVGAGDEVLVPATAPVMTALPVLALGAEPVFVDVADALSFRLDLADIERKRSGRTRAVVSVPMWGYPADGRELVEACRSWGLPLVEDAAQAHGSRLDGRYLGTAGLVGAFSTHMRKLVSTGEGGFCLTDDEQVADRLRELHDLGRPANAADGGFGERFGLNYKLTGLAAAVGAVQLQRLGERLARRREVAERLTGGLAGIPGLHPLPVASGGVPNYYALVLRTDRGAHELAAELAAVGVVSDTLRYRYRPLPRMPLFAGGDPAPCPRAEQLCASVVTVPAHEGVTEADETRIVDACRAWSAGRG